MADQGTFIVIEGSDGSGKGTQFKLLKERLKAVGYKVAEFDFPRYEQPSSHFIRKYLNGEYGQAKDISPYTASLFYALDRFEAAADIRSALKQGKVVLANRYVGSNMAHQGAKIEDPVEQRSFFVWEDSLEFQLLDLPRPNINIFLRVPAEISYELIRKKSTRSYTNKSHDEHEANLNYLKKTVDTYDLLCQLFPRDFTAIDCTKDSKMLSITDINNLIWQDIASYLPPKPAGRARSVTLRLDAEDKKTVKKEVKPSTEQNTSRYLKSVRLSLGQVMKAESVLPGAVHYNLSWAKSSYGYVGLKNLPKNVLKKYDQSMETLIGLTKNMQSKLPTGANEGGLLAAVLPLGALVEVDFALKPSDIKKIARYLGASSTGQPAELLNQFISQLDGQAGKPTTANSQKIIYKLAQDLLSNSLDAQVDPVTLLDYGPRNEFKLLADGLYSFSNMSKEQLGKEIERWSYQQKSTALVELLSTKGLGLDGVARYRFDLLADQLTINKLIKAGIDSGSVQIQPPSPRYGYDVPSAAEHLGIEDEFIKCFDTSLELFSSLQAAGEEDLARVAVLLGHKTRFQLECSLDSMRTILGSEDRVAATLARQMLEKISEVHPIIGSSLNKKTTQRQSVPKNSRRSRSKK